MCVSARPCCAFSCMHALPLMHTVPACPVAAAAVVCFFCCRLQGCPPVQLVQDVRGQEGLDLCGGGCRLLPDQHLCGYPSAQAQGAEGPGRTRREIEVGGVLCVCWLGACVWVVAVCVWGGWMVGCCLTSIFMGILPECAEGPGRRGGEEEVGGGRVTAERAWVVIGGTAGCCLISILSGNPRSTGMCRGTWTHRRRE
jgi:hypothetical protein